ncbi:aspartoacylase [Vibrio campbellii]|uniref:aspartoacylase n=1 Tax=Vibrio campbellii TaxID=680 RepID=UPI0002AE1C3D|nr:aspartoacylase [Vibrio campbellii]ARV75475.1 aspartoacylase [Vibrio campbellii CAIM 519 = NBRC 15631 = ATCC 25920]ELU53188.1 aspartoacylase [Vibrio campbellii CAIM 519 = NBRC 15631 = ATCC 25920]HDM8042663.1 aspartoacylase [Vibrio campbellii]
MDKLNRVLLVAGTHGNELSGIYLQKLIKDRLYDAERSTFSTQCVLGNPEAVKQNVRYVETDLNREFALANSSASSHREGGSLQETELAKQFTQTHAAEEKQLIVDLHNTTSNMGATLILVSNDVFYRKMGAYVKQRMPEANILFEDRKAWDDQPYLCTTGQHGVMIEVGAQAHGSLNYETLELMKKMLTMVLDYLEQHNLGQVGELNNYDAYFYTEEVMIPVDHDGMRVAIVHPMICGRDFEVVKPGEPLLATFFGYDIFWEGKQEIYPHFINESAYSKANIAMALAEKRQVNVE